VNEIEPVAAALALGATLRRHRMAKGMSLRMLARRIGLSAHGTLVDYEHGRRIPPEDLLVACEKVLDLDDGTLRRLRSEALAERAEAEAAILLTAPNTAPSSAPGGPSSAPGAAPNGGRSAAPAAAAVPVSVPGPDQPGPGRSGPRFGPRRWGRRPVPMLVVVMAAVVLAAAGTALLVRHDSADGRPAAALGTPAATPASGTPRFGFEKPSDDWVIFWGAQKAKSEVSDDRHYEGTHSFQVTTAGPSMNGPGPKFGYVAFGTTHGLRTLHAGMRVTMHIWTSYPKDGFQFMVYDGHSHKVNAPETPRDGTEMTLRPGPDGWATVRWTVPKVPVVGAIIVQPYQRDDTPRVIAVDAVSW
jgi:transcriptional regulator with XRE-family HTH domain